MKKIPQGLPAGISATRFTRPALAAAAIATAMVPLTATPADARPVTITEHEHKATISLRIENPCSGVPGLLTEVENGVFHLTAAAIDTGNPDDPTDDRPVPPYTSTFNVENRFSFVPDDPDQPSYSGHSHTHISERFKAFPGVAQLENTIQARGDDGSVLRLRWVERVSIQADGTMDEEPIFSRFSCESG